MTQWSDMNINSAKSRSEFRDREPSTPIWPPQHPFGFRSPSTVNLLYVNSESREVALKHYERAFGTEWKSPMTWFDFKVDTLYVDWGFAKRTKAKCDAYAFAAWSFGGCAAKVKTLATYDHAGINTAVEDDNDFQDWYRGILKHFCHLEELVLVDRYHYNRDDHRTDLVMMDEVVAFRQAMKIYKDEKGKSYSEEAAKKVLEEHEDWRHVFKYRAGLVDVYDMNPSGPFHHDNDDWDIPQFSRRTITTNSRLKKYEKAMKAFEKNKPLEEVRMEEVTDEAEAAPAVQPESGYESDVLMADAE